MAARKKVRYISILAENHSGVLLRLAGLIRRRGHNINALTVGETQKGGISYITVAISPTESIAALMQQIEKQLVVVAVHELTENEVRESMTIHGVMDARTAKAIARSVPNGTLQTGEKSYTIFGFGSPMHISSALKTLRPSIKKFRVTRSGPSGLPII